MTPPTRGGKRRVFGGALHAGLTVAGLTLAHPFIAVQTDIPDIVSSGTAYMRICGGLSFGLFLEIMFERLLQATGRTFYTMLTQGTGPSSTSSWTRCSSSASVLFRK